MGEDLSYSTHSTTMAPSTTKITSITSSYESPYTLHPFDNIGALITSILWRDNYSKCLTEFWNSLQAKHRLVSSMVQLLNLQQILTCSLDCHKLHDCWLDSYLYWPYHSVDGYPCSRIPMRSIFENHCNDDSLLKMEFLNACLGMILLIANKTWNQSLSIMVGFPSSGKSFRMLLLLLCVLVMHLQQSRKNERMLEFISSLL